MNKIRNAAILSAALIGISGNLSAQVKSAGPVKDSITKTLADSSSHKKANELKPYKDVIKGNVLTMKGLVTVHQIEDKYYYEIPLSLFKKDILIINRIAEGAVNMNIGSKSDGYAGDGIGGNVIQFERGPANKLFIRKMFYTDISTDSTKPMYQSILKNSVQPIIASIPIAAFSTDSANVVVDMTDLLNSDNDLFYFSSPVFKQIMHLGSQQNDKSYVKYVHSYPQNTEIRTVKTYGLGGTTAGGNVTLELNSSMVLLPEHQMKWRKFDARVGYFGESFMDYDANPDGVSPLRLVARWRLEPKKGEEKKYLKGQLVEPQKPIVFYIDPSTPSKWIPYLIAGINDWNVAFEKAGFKNAIIGKMAPTKAEDSTFSLEDARHNAIIYKPSMIANASGPHISDPRTGEILESHVNWYHNVMALIHNWYMLQCGAVDPEARHMEFPDSLMGQLIRFVSSHEIGHTLGLMHNFGASSSVPVDSLRNKKWVEAHGHSPSIMDYARFNYVAQPEDHIGHAGLFPRIGDYDKWAIEWGYKWYPDSVSIDRETTLLNRLTTEKQKQRNLWFGFEATPSDPRSQNEDEGDNAMRANTYGIMNLKRILPNLPEWTKMPNEDYSNLEELYSDLNKQYDRYLLHVLKYIGGTYVTPKTVEQGGDVFTPVPAALQKEALDFFDKQLFQTPLWLIDPNIVGKLKIDPLVLMAQRQDVLLGILIHNATIAGMLRSETLYGDKAFKMTDFFQILDKSIFKEFDQQNTVVDIYRRNLQKMYLDKVLLIAFPATEKVDLGATQHGPQRSTPVLPASFNDGASYARSEVRSYLTMFQGKLGNITDPMTKAHVQDMIDRIDIALKDYK